MAYFQAHEARRGGERGERFYPEFHCLGNKVAKSAGKPLRLGLYKDDSEQSSLMPDCNELLLQFAKLDFGAEPRP